jgi:hypothetical protein
MSSSQQVENDIQPAEMRFVDAFVTQQLRSYMAE